MKIIVVEDNPDIQEVLNYILEYEGHEVISSSDGTFLDNLNETNPDIILLDEILAAQRGSELCRQLKVNSETRHIPVVLISAKPHLSEIALKCGADAYIEKPFNIDALTDVIKRLT